MEERKMNWVEWRCGCGLEGMPLGGEARLEGMPLGGEAGGVGWRG